VKDYKRLNVGAVCGNTPSGVIGINVVDYDGGDFKLHPKIYPGGLILVDPNRPAAYGVQFTGTSENLKALGNALIAASRMTGDDSGNED
jgi:hypothetical protein